MALGGRLGLVLLLTACAPFRPGEGVTPRFAEDYGCDPVWVEQAARALSAELGADETYIPEVGWTACELMAHVGRPARIEYTRSRYGNAVSWWCETTDDVRLVMLRERDGLWIVDYVGW